MVRAPARWTPDGAPNYLDVLTGAGFDVVDKPLLNWYVSEEKKRNGHEIGEVKWKQVKKNHDDTLGQGEDVVYVIGRVGGEGNDVGAGIEDTFEESGDYLHLNEAELSVLEGLKGMKDDGNIRSITVIVNSANPVSMAFADEEDYGVDAVLWVGSSVRRSVRLGRRAFRRGEPVRFAAGHLVEGQSA